MCAWSFGKSLGPLAGLLVRALLNAPLKIGSNLTQRSQLPIDLTNVRWQAEQIADKVEGITDDGYAIDKKYQVPVAVQGLAQALPNTLLSRNLRVAEGNILVLETLPIRSAWEAFFTQPFRFNIFDYFSKIHGFTRMRKIS